METCDFLMQFSYERNDTAYQCTVPLFEFTGIAFVYRHSIQWHWHFCYVPLEKLNWFLELGSHGSANGNWILAVFWQFINIVYTRNKVKCSCIYQEHGLDSLVLIRSSSPVTGAFPNWLRGATWGKEPRSRNGFQVEVRRIARIPLLIRNRTRLVFSHTKANSAQSACVATTGFFLLLASNSKGLAASSLQDRQQNMMK